jgi:transcriptional regulator with XRE-family HTH domain
MEFSPEQCRAARGLLDWSQPKLAEASETSISTVVDFERSRRKMSQEMIQSLRVALEVAGVMFGNDGSVKLRKLKK